MQAFQKAILKEHMKAGDPSVILTDDSEIALDEQRLVAGWNCTSLPTLCDTRWLSRCNSISALVMNYKHVHNSLDEIHISSKAQSSADVQSYMNSMELFQFIYTSVISQYILAYIRPLSLAQGFSN